MEYPSNHLFYLVFVAFVMFGCTSTPSQIGHEDAIQLPKVEASNYAVYAMMTSNAYLDSERTYFPIEDRGSRMDSC